MWLGRWRDLIHLNKYPSGRKKQKLKPLVPAHRAPPQCCPEAKGFTAFLWGWDGVLGNSSNIGREVLHFNFCFPLGDLETDSLRLWRKLILLFCGGKCLEMAGGHEKCQNVISNLMAPNS